MNTLNWHIVRVRELEDALKAVREDQGFDELNGLTKTKVIDALGGEETDE